MPVLFAFLHHLAAFTLAAGIVVEWLLMRDAPTPRSVKRLARADAFVGLAAVGVLAIGVLRVMYFEKGSAYYMHNLAFFAKFGLFVGIALVSVYPTMRFIAWNRVVKAGDALRIAADELTTVRKMLHLELVGLVLILACAAMMARGIGTFA